MTFTGGGVVMLRCPYCLHYIKSHAILDTHADIFHGVKICSRDRTDVKRLTVYPCELCKGCIFSSVHSYSTHLKQVHSKPLFACDQCDKSYFSKGHLKKHKRTKHGGHKDYYCKYCLKEYNDRVRVVEHMTRDHPGNEPHLEPGKNFGKQETTYEMTKETSFEEMYSESKDDNDTPLTMIKTENITMDTAMIKTEPFIQTSQFYDPLPFSDPSPHVPYPTMTPSCHDLSLKPYVTPFTTASSFPSVTPVFPKSTVPTVTLSAQPSVTLLSEPSVTPMIMDPSLQPTVILQTSHSMSL